MHQENIEENNHCRREKWQNKGESQRGEERRKEDRNVVARKYKVPTVVAHGVRDMCGHHVYVALQSQHLE